jgi:hypothetical protein
MLAGRGPASNGAGSPRHKRSTSHRKGSELEDRAADVDRMHLLTYAARKSWRFGIKPIVVAWFQQLYQVPELEVFLQVAVTYIPFLQRAFSTVPLKITVT